MIGKSALPISQHDGQGLRCCAYKVGTTQDLQRWQRVLLSSVVAVLVCTGIVAYGLITQMRAASHNVSYAHAERVIDVGGVEIALFARSAGARGFLLSGDPLFLESRAAAKADLERRLDALRIHDVDARTLADIDVLVGRLDTASDRAISTYTTSSGEARKIWESEARP